MGITCNVARRRRLRSSWLSLARSAEGKLPSAKQTGWNRSMDEKQDTAVRPSKKTKRYEMQKFRVIRLQIEVQNRADSGHRQRAKRICRTIRTSFPKEIRKWISVDLPHCPIAITGEQRSGFAEPLGKEFPKNYFPLHSIFLNRTV